MRTGKYAEIEWGRYYLRIEVDDTLGEFEMYAGDERVLSGHVTELKPLLLWLKSVIDEWEADDEEEVKNDG